MLRVVVGLSLMLISGAVGCGSSSPSGGGGAGAGAGGSGGGGAAASPDGAVPADEYRFETTTFSLQAGEEKYMCFARTLTEDMVIDRFDYQHSQAVHHFLLAQTTSPEPDGLTECHVLFRTTWAPMFGAATADASLQMPDGVGITLPKGTQILIQLHLLNATPMPYSGTAAVSLHKTARTGLEPVGIYAFGTTALDLPAQRMTDVSSSCQPGDDLELFAVLPHMHYLGKNLRFEVGDSATTMQEVYRRDPWSFDDQRIELKSLHIARGTHTRVTCTFENPGDGAVHFGESSHDEMCFLVAFARNRDGLDGCITTPDVQPVPPDPAAGMCGMQMANSKGIGAHCTRGGNECMSGLICSADQSQSGAQTQGFCMQIGGCEATADCGGGWATCCAPAEAGGILNICLPEACRPADCIPR